MGQRYQVHTTMSLVCPCMGSHWARFICLGVLLLHFMYCQQWQLGSQLQLLSTQMYPYNYPRFKFVSIQMSINSSIVIYILYVHTRLSINIMVKSFYVYTLDKYNILDMV